jgi:ubiquinone/menaquinone biosynthesis C-methylase UbiE
MPRQIDDSSPLLPEAQRYYSEYNEAGRLFRGAGQLERLRTQEIITRYATPAPATVLDIGGGPGVYALWLARQGYTVHLLDAMPLHIEQAREAAQDQSDTPLASLQVGDARHLPFEDESAEIVLLLGPLYHLVERSERLLALREARRVLRPGGWLFAAAISRFAPLLQGFFSIPEALLDADEIELLHHDVTTGQHRNFSGDINNFTTTYFHHPDELRSEVSEAGLHDKAILAVEGPIWASAGTITHLQNEQWRANYLSLMRLVEHDPTLLGSSAHLLAVARRES